MTIRYLLIGFIVFQCFLSESFALPELADRVRLLFVIDDVHSARRGHDLSAECSFSKDALLKSFENAAERDSRFRYTVDVFEGEDVSADLVQWYYSEYLKQPQNAVQPNDALFFYYCGHGLYDPRQGHFLAFGHGATLHGSNLARRFIREFQLALKPRSAFIFTDACSVFADADASPAAPEPKWDAFVDLFMRPVGVVDISAAAEGKVAWFSRAGGAFTNALDQTISLEQKFLDSNRNGVVTWDEVFNQIKSRTEQAQDMIKSGAASLEVKKAEVQVPKGYYLGGVWPKYERWIYVNNNTGEPVRFWYKYQSVTPQGRWTWFPTDPSVDRQSYFIDIGANQRIQLPKPDNSGFISSRAMILSILGQQTNTTYANDFYLEIVNLEGEPSQDINVWKDAVINVANKK